MATPLTPDRLRRTTDPTALGIETTEHLAPLSGIVGQERAVSALRFGLGIGAVGFNIYVSGTPGIGKMTAVHAFLEEVARRAKTPPDWCYVNDFGDPSQPRALRLPPGRGRRFQQDMRGLIDHARREIPKAFESEEYGTKRDEIGKAFDRERTALLQGLHSRAAESGFQLRPTPLGVLVVPVLGGRPLSDAEVQALPQAARDDLAARRERIQDDLNGALKQLRDMGRAAEERLEELDRKVALYVVGGLINDLIERYRDVAGIPGHLEAVQKDILENIENLKREKAGEEEGTPEASPRGPRDPFRRWQVNVFVDNGKREGAPVVVELNPSYNNLLGRVDRESSLGTVYTDFTMIKAGSIHLANGGYLVLRVEDLLRNLGSWEGLKRALRTREIKLEELAERLGFVSVKSLRPEPIPLDIKVVLVGPPLLYYLLHDLDEEFPELFKVKADFDTRMARSDANVLSLLGFLRTLCEKEELAHLDAGAAAKVLDHAARLSEDQEKLSTHFGAIADVLREAGYWAREAGAARVGAEHVQRALDEKVYRSSLIQERIQELMAQGTLLVDTSGAVVGQVNGLSVLSLGDYAFGRPTRITASVGPGAEGVVDIEREVELSGPIHSKGVMILSGYLLRKFGAEVPLSLESRIVFEQSYEEVEGDSASSAELYAILSALSGLPIRQDVAVTGSVNQGGEVQAVGGVNQKVEGFFDLCRTRGLTGDQGVIIPASNVRNLMLREDVVEAVRAGKFHVWSVRTIDEGIELLTGAAAGERGPDGRFADGSVNDLVELRLREFAQTLKEMGKTAPPGQRRLLR